MPLTNLCLRIQSLVHNTEYFFDYKCEPGRWGGYISTSIIQGCAPWKIRVGHQMFRIKTIYLYKSRFSMAKGITTQTLNVFKIYTRISSRMLTASCSVIAKLLWKKAPLSASGSYAVKTSWYTRPCGCTHRKVIQNICGKAAGEPAIFLYSRRRSLVSRAVIGSQARISMILTNRS